MEDKITSGVELGDKITCHWEDEDTGKHKHMTGIVIDIDHNDKTSGEFAMFHLGNKKGQSFWYYGSQIENHTKNDKK